MGDNTLRGQYAGFVSRFIAILIDLLVVSLISIVVIWTITLPAEILGINLTEQCTSIDTGSLITFFQSSWCYLIKFAVPTVTFFVWIGYPLILWTLTGETVGKYAMGLRIVRMDGQPLNIINSVRRLIGYVVSFVVLGLGFFWILVSNSRQGWHDKIGGTYVIYTWDARASARLQGRISSFVNRLSDKRRPNNSTPA